MTSYSAKLQEFVETLLAHHHAKDNDVPLRLHLLGMELLMISYVVERREVRLSHFVTTYDHVPNKDLEIVFSVDSEERWIPYQYYRPPTDNQVCGVIDARLHKLVIDNPSYQRALASQCDLWATRLENQGWLEQGMTFDPVELGLAGEFLWPLPTTDEPDEDQIETWLIDDVCEATDGCLVEPDGTCPHGHPSWLLRMGLV